MILFIKEDYMEGYIKRINDKITKNNNEQKQKKIKKIYLLSGGLTLALGLAGFLASFISFIVLFFKFDTDRALIAWFVAIPFILMIVAGSVVTRIGDMLLKDNSTEDKNQVQIVTTEMNKEINNNDNDKAEK